MKTCKCRTHGCSVKGVQFPTGTVYRYIALPLGWFVIMVGNHPVGPIKAKVFFQNFVTIKE